MYVSGEAFSGFLAELACFMVEEKHVMGSIIVLCRRF